MSKTWRVLLNLAILLVVVAFVWYMARSVNKEETTYAEAPREEPFTSRYTKVSSIDLPEEINRFDLADGMLYISAGQTVYLFNTNGKKQASFPVKPDVCDILADGEEIYVLYPTFIEVYSTNGSLIREWEACSELSGYCSIALAGGHLFVTDAENKNICQYTLEGNFVRFIQSPRGFIVPSYSSDITSRNDTVYCVNPGRHLVETYTPTGEFIAAFGGPGGEAGFFAGCCNPAYVSFTPEGELITSEKGNPRVSVFGKNGVFREMLLNNRLLGGGSKAYETHTDGEMLFTARKNKIDVYGI